MLSEIITIVFFKVSLGLEVRSFHPDDIVEFKDFLQLLEKTNVDYSVGIYKLEEPLIIHRREVKK